MATTPLTPPKKRSPRAAVGATTARTLDRREQVLQLLLQGKRSPEIGTIIGVSRVRAWEIAKEALAQVREETLELGALWRDRLTVEHEEQLKTAVGLRKKSSDLQAQDVGLKAAHRALQELRALWVPALPTTVKSELSGPDGGPVPVGAPNLGALSDDQLVQLELLLSTAASVRPGEVVGEAAPGGG